MKDVIDYKALLRKYMELVLSCEGVTFVSLRGDDEFTADEVAALEAITEEINL